jgi:hypothetical protein|tara:strand:- start:22 stop:462 length:441 start_codon:yes stop_codon:yes gene_type:complete
MERIITCPHCLDQDHCFEDVQENHSSYLCFSCGFMSDSRYSTDSLELEDSLKKSPQLIIKNQFKDNQRNIVWFPAVINMGSKGMIFPEGTDKDYVWKYAKVIDIPKEEQSLYDNYNQRLDIDNAQEFKKDDFIGACKAMGITERIK